MLTYNIHFTLQLLLILSYKAFGVLKWSSAIKIETCTCWYYKYILRANLMLMLFNWWIFTYSHTFLHLFMYFFFSTLFRQSSRKWSGRQSNSQTQSKSSLWRWIWQKTEYLQLLRTERTPLLSWHALLYSGSEAPLFNHVMQANTSLSLPLKYPSSPALFFSYFLM